LKRVVVHFSATQDNQQQRLQSNKLNTTKINAKNEPAEYCYDDRQWMPSPQVLEKRALSLPI